VPVPRLSALGLVPAASDSARHAIRSQHRVISAVRVFHTRPQVIRLAVLVQAAHAEGHGRRASSRYAEGMDARRPQPGPRTQLADGRPVLLADQVALGQRSRWLFAGIPGWVDVG